MRVKTLDLTQFRNYEHASIVPDSGMNILIGPNAQGKTNILEALYLCCVGRSHRTARDEELIRWGQMMARVRLTCEQHDGTHDVSVSILRGEKKKKIVKIGAGQAERIGELMGHVRGVLFSPEDLLLIKGGPGERRRFLDMELSQLRPQYFYTLQRASRALCQRNALLKEIAVKPALLSTLDLWDEQLAETGAQIAAQRREAVEKLGALAGEAHASLSAGREKLTMRYVSQVGDGADAKEKLLKRLINGREDDLRRQTTQTGIHRDDILIGIDGKDARTFASQGQQRSAALSVKLAQLEMTEKETGEAPILLLDDVMSELDSFRRRQLIERIDRAQTFITCTDLSDLAQAQKGMVMHVKEGTIC